MNMENAREWASPICFFSSYKSGHRREVAILISNRLNFEKVFEMGDKEGRFILVREYRWSANNFNKYICAPWK